MVWIDHATLLHPDGRRARIDRVEVVYSGQEPSVRVDEADAPPWDGAGIDVVAARDDGSVECSFTVGNAQTVTFVDGEGRPDPRGAKRVYRP